jgi:hypothetical protein
VHARIPAKSAPVGVASAHDVEAVPKAGGTSVSKLSSATLAFLLRRPRSPLFDVYSPA